MKKLTKIQKKQIRELEKAWEATGPVDLRIIILFIVAIVDNKFNDLLGKIEKRETFEKIQNEYIETAKT